MYPTLSGTYHHVPIVFAFLYVGHKKNLEQFLNQLPSSVIRDGKVIDIRNSLSETIKVNIRHY